MHAQAAQSARKGSADEMLALTAVAYSLVFVHVCFGFDVWVCAHAVVGGCACVVND